MFTEVVSIMCNRGIVFVPQGAEESLPQRLLPAEAAGASLEQGGLALQSYMCSLMDQVQQSRRRHGAQRGAALAAQMFEQVLPAAPRVGCSLLTLPGRAGKG